MFPSALQELIDLFEHLPEPERRENLIDIAETAISHTRQAGVDYEIADVRKDQECSDTVGVYVRRDDSGQVFFAIELGPKVQTLTRAMTAILCRGLNGSTPDQILHVPQDFVPRIIGADLVRLRSQTVYYVLNRMKQAVGKLMPAAPSAIPSTK
jgi:cysteine desulfuration protein SufE